MYAACCVLPQPGWTECLGQDEQALLTLLTIHRERLSV